MAKLDAAERKKISAKDFALPGRRYPIEDKAHAKSALSRASSNATPSEQETIRRKVTKKFPDMHVAHKPTVKSK